MLRLRIEPKIRASGTTTFNFAYEQRLHYASAPAVGIGGVGILPSELATPFRVEPLVWRVNASARGTWRHEIDRANAQVHLRRADLTIGRQAIGWGRGVMFTSVDLFAPFSPLEVDREWRSGVDAVRADIKLTDRSSVDLVGAFGDTLDRSAFAARARGYAGTIDVEVLAVGVDRNYSEASRRLRRWAMPKCTARRQRFASPRGGPRRRVESRGRRVVSISDRRGHPGVRGISLLRVWCRTPRGDSGAAHNAGVRRTLGSRRHADSLQARRRRDRLVRSVAGDHVFRAVAAQPRGSVRASSRPQ